MHIILQSMRLPFLTLTPVCVLLGLATAKQSGVEIEPGIFLLALTGALSAHISVNTFNEYQDFRSGLDLVTLKTPFSGGSGALPANPQKASLVLTTAVLSLLVTIAVGLYFIQLRGWGILPIGLAGLVLILGYTGWVNRHPFLCLLAPGLGFGPLMVMGTHFVLTGHYSLPAFIASLVPLFLVSNLLLLNQYPDIEADKSVGRRHFPITFGTRASSRVYAIFATLAALTVLIGITLGHLPLSGLISLMPLPFVIAVYRGVRKHPADPEKLLPWLGMNVAVTLAVPLLLGLSLLLT